MVLALFYVVAIQPAPITTGSDIKSVHIQAAKIKQFLQKPKIHLLLAAKFI
jgi:hypothetical protein